MAHNDIIIFLHQQPMSSLLNVQILCCSSCSVLQKPWVLGTMEVAWLLVVFIAIVTYAPQLTCSGAGYVLGKRSQTEIGPIRSEQSDTSDAKK